MSFNSSEPTRAFHRLLTHNRTSKLECSVVQKAHAEGNLAAAIASLEKCLSRLMTDQTIFHPCAEITASGADAKYRNVGYCATNGVRADSTSGTQAYALDGQQPARRVAQAVGRSRRLLTQI